MILINPQPEPSPPIIKPRKDETLRSWLNRKRFAEMSYAFGVTFPRQSWHTKLIKHLQMVRELTC